ncbi:Zn-dependent protease with chaperone function [Catenulispora sp. MAP12-49]|uniref:M56 family metallopeptidase n=1 Tax=Catenulispora sp. MAP12-49 TaxID=3156302 RepID=UPI003512D6E8
MFADAWPLAVLAVLLAWPVPILLARAAWPRRHARAAIALWQAVGIAGGLALIGAPLAVGVAPLDKHLRTGLVVLWRDAFHLRVPASLGLLQEAALALAAVLTVRLVGVTLLSALRIERDLRRQRDAVDLAAEHADRQLRVLEHASPAAYCLPGTRPRIVITEGTIAALAPEELEAVLAHERAHAKWRHELVVQPFVAWESALPLPPARRATASVTALVEMLADDHAARAVGRPALARALVAIGGTAGPVPNQRAEHDQGADGPGAARVTPTLDRVQRLVKAPAAALSERLVGSAAWFAAVLLVAGPTWYVLR